MEMGGRKKMFSPNMYRYIIDPDNAADESVENRKVTVEKQIFRYSLLDHEKVLTDYSFFSKIFKSFGRAFEVFVSQSR